MVSLLGRTDDVEHLWALLERGHVRLTGPRRIGKSALLKSMASEPKSAWRAGYVDLEGKRSGEAGADTMAAALVERHLTPPPLRVAEAVRNSVAGVAGLNLRPGAGGWDRVDLHLAQAVRALRPGERLVLFLDEVPWWLEAAEKGAPGSAREGLARLRRLRQNPSLEERIRMVFTGSVGLAGVIQDVHASAEMNDIELSFELPPLAQEPGTTLFEQDLAGLGRDCTAEAATRAWKEAGGVPFWIKRLASAAPGAGLVDTETVGRAIDALLQPALRNEFREEGWEHFERRYGADERVAATRMLACACQGVSEPKSEAELLSAALAARPGLGRREAEELLWRLLDTFYLRRDDDGYRVRIPLFARWWGQYGRLD